MSLSVAPADHAFASGRAFARVESVHEAKKALTAGAEVVDERDARLLVQVWRQFAGGAILGPNILLALNARLINLSAAERVRLHGDSVLRGMLRVERGGALEVERFCYIGDNVIISAQERIVIGEATLLAHGVQVFDNNTHPLSAAQREVHFRRMMGHKDLSARLEIDTAPVHIGKRCWLAMNALVMKGVSIGDDTLVTAGSVVINDLPEGVIAGGNPARVLRNLTPEERFSV
jgi:acetyltransferase-like isoleucine patch superfamily enzyme